MGVKRRKSGPFGGYKIYTPFTPYSYIVSPPPPITPLLLHRFSLQYPLFLHRFTKSFTLFTPSHPTVTSFYPHNRPLIVHHFTAKNYPPLTPLLLLLRRITPPPPISPQGSFPFVPASLEGAFNLRPPDARAIFLHNNSLCNDTCSVSGGRITYLGAQTEKILLQNDVRVLSGISKKIPGLPPYLKKILC